MLWTSVLSTAGQTARRCPPPGVARAVAFQLSALPVTPPLLLASSLRSSPCCPPGSLPLPGPPNPHHCCRCVVRTGLCTKDTDRCCLSGDVCKLNPVDNKKYCGE